MSNFRTVFPIEQSIQKLAHKDKVLFIGSCFADNIGKKFLYYKFDTCLNPFGIIYNPVTVAESLQLTLQRKVFTEEDLFYFNNKWISFKHHGDFSQTDKTRCLKKINDSITRAYDFLKRGRFLFITFGTAWAYKYKKTGEVAANCHKIPAKEFDRFLLQPEEIACIYKELIQKIKSLNKDIQIVFTVSPVRHWKDGAHGNQVSKSILHYSLSLIQDENKGIMYFPSYELVMDDLRDYRFYAEDMLHPSAMAVDYIWERFSEVYFEKETCQLMNKIGKLNKALSHRPIDSESDAHQSFLKKQLNKILNLLSENSFINYEDEIRQIKTQIKG